MLLESTLVRSRWQDLNKNLLTALSGRNVLDTWLVELLFFFRVIVKILGINYNMTRLARMTNRVVITLLVSARLCAGHHHVQYLNLIPTNVQSKLFIVVIIT